MGNKITEKKYKKKLPMDKIKSRYLNYESCSQIAKDYNTSKDTILSRLRDMGVKIRKSGDVGFGYSKIVKNNYPICEVVNCNNKSTVKKRDGKYYCKYHNLNLIVYDDVNAIRYYDMENKVISNKNGICELECYNMGGEVIGTFFIDSFNLTFVKKHKWSFSSKGYIRRNGGSNTHDSLHRYLTGYKFNKVDHIDRNPQNNLMSNLREASNNENGYNCTVGKNNKSGVIGIHYDKERSKWKSTIKDNYKNIMSRFDNFDDAVKHRILLESKYAKEFSPNFNPITNTIQLTYISHDDGKETFIEVSLDGITLNFIKNKEK